jgi:hypothetical protein
MALQKNKQLIIEKKNLQLKQDTLDAHIPHNLCTVSLDQKHINSLSVFSKRKKEMGDFQEHGCTSIEARRILKAISWQYFPLNG